jgi:hypothetical protein
MLSSKFHTTAVLTVIARMYGLSQNLQGFCLSISISSAGLIYFEILYHKTGFEFQQEWENMFQTLGLVISTIMLTQSLSILTGVAVSRDLTLSQLVLNTPYEYTTMGFTFAICAAMLLWLQTTISSHDHSEYGVQEIKQGITILHILTVFALWMLQPKDSNLISAIPIALGVGIIIAYNKLSRNRILHQYY